MISFTRFNAIRKRQSYRQFFFFFFDISYTFNIFYIKLKFKILIENLLFSFFFSYKTNCDNSCTFYSFLKIFKIHCRYCSIYSIYKLYYIPNYWKYCKNVSIRQLSDFNCLMISICPSNIYIKNVVTYASLNLSWKM